MILLAVFRVSRYEALILFTAFRVASLPLLSVMCVSYILLLLNNQN